MMNHSGMNYFEIPVPGRYDRNGRLNTGCKLIEGAAEESDELLDKVPARSTIPLREDEIIAAFRKATLEGRITRYSAVHLSRTKAFRN